MLSSMPVKLREGRKRPSRMRVKQNLEGWLFASPWIIGFVLFLAGPMLASAILSFTSWDIVTPAQWIGLANFSTLSNDPNVLQSLRVTTLYAVVSVPLNIGLGLAVAMLLNTGVAGIRFWRTFYYLPSVLSGVAVSLLWLWIFQPEFGVLNTLLLYVGIHGPGWLSSTQWALPALIIMSLWNVGAGMVIYLAGLQGVPTELYEAAEVDGSGFFPKLWSITLPLMSPVLFFQLVTGMIAALQVFTEAYVMTQGGPMNATLFFMLYLYNNAFQYFKMGYASALAWVLFFYILLLTLLVLRSARSWVYYEGESTR